MVRKISIDIPDDIYNNIKKRSYDETVNQKKFIGMNDIVLPVLKKAFSKKH